MPPALFSVGTADALLDDTLFMHGRWLAAGNAAELAILPGKSTVFTLFWKRQSEQAEARAVAFLKGVVT